MSDSTRTPADVLHSADNGGHWPDEVAEPVDLDDGLRVQLEVLERHIAGGDRLRGWKVALTAGAGRDMMGPDFRPFGYLLDSRVLPSGASVARPSLGVARVEAELCLVIGEPPMGPQVTPEQAREAVREVAPAFEINEIRFPGGASHPVMIADNLGGWGAVLGTEVAVPDHDLTTTRVDVWRDEQPVAFPASDLELEDPFLSLARLARLLHEHGHSLRPGDVVITGALWYADVPDEPVSYRARFAEVGEVTLDFT